MITFIKTYYFFVLGFIFFLGLLSNSVLTQAVAVVAFLSVGLVRKVVEAQCAY